MPHSSQRPVLCVTVDFHPSPEGPSLAEHRGATAAAKSLQAVLDEHHVPAAWAVAQPVASPLTDSLLSAATGHELALLADRSWAGRDAPRSRFVGQLSRQLLRARAAGMPIGTLALSQGAVVAHADLLVKYGVRLIRDTSQTPRHGRWLARSRKLASTSAPVSLRWGLWRLPTTANLSDTGYTALRRQLDYTAATDGLLTLVIDLNRFMEGGRPAMKHVERIAALVARRRERGTLAIEAPRDLVARLTPHRQTSPARSILKLAG